MEKILTTITGKSAAKDKHWIFHDFLQRTSRGRIKLSLLSDSSPKSSEQWFRRMSVGRSATESSSAVTWFVASISDQNFSPDIKPCRFLWVLFNFQFFIDFSPKLATTVILDTEFIIFIIGVWLIFLGTQNCRDLGVTIDIDFRKTKKQKKRFQYHTSSATKIDLHKIKNLRRSVNLFFNFRTEEIRWSSYGSVTRLPLERFLKSRSWNETLVLKFGFWLRAIL